VLRLANVWLFLGISLVASMATAQAPCSHLADPARDLYRGSAFAHGYIHGYESGFHLGDLDLQLGHSALVLLTPKTRLSDTGYQPSFGDKKAFKHGFEQGQRTGYGDAYRGDSFRGVAEVRRAAQGMSAEAAQREEFDQAVSHGYEAGWQAGLRRPLTSLDPREAAKACQGSSFTGGLCDAYARGFGLGYADAALFHEDKAVRIAKKAGN
jgi:hypothetical protein